MLRKEIEWVGIVLFGWGWYIVDFVRKWDLRVRVG